MHYYMINYFIVIVQIDVQITTITKWLVNNDVPQQVKSFHNDTFANHY